MAEGNSTKNDTVGLFLRAMVDREPGKRKVKPSKAALIDLAELDLGESSDDSDFNVDEEKLKEDDDISINSDPDDDDNEDNDDEDDSDDDDEAEDACENIKTVSKLKANMTISELLAEAQEKQAAAAQQGVTRPKILVCAICLGEYSDDTNEIVTCDGCHVSVHEGCYGISDTISVSSTVSSSSTEPWFCDACKAGVTDPPCELCPNLGYTIFKETEMGRWVHLVCALYVPGVAFSEVDKLSFPTLFEMPYSRYGAKTCSLCEDERFCKTGVCIGCDAGMCRSYFHVTCAQREGLLSEVNHGEADQADPYYAHCKLHTDRELMRRRKRNWLALQMHMKQGEKEKLSESQEIQDRLQRKLIKYREKYLFTKSNRPAPWFPTQKMPRSLSTNASFFRSMLQKTKLMGIETESTVQEPQSLGDVRKKWHISPAFNVEFITYYLDRTSRLQEMKSKLDFLLKENDELMKEETELRNRYNKLNKESQSLETESTELLNKALEMHDILKGLAGRPLRLPPVVAALHNPPYVDVEATNIAGLTCGLGLGKEKRLITKAAAKMIGGSMPGSSSGMDGSTAPKSSPLKTAVVANFGGSDNASVVSIHTCSVCQSMKDQHLLIQCDTCNNYYHLACLDPPLTRMPKKTKQMGWQCSDCCKSSDSDKAPEIDTTAPRRLRRIIKEPSKFSPSVRDQKGEQERPSEDDGKSAAGPTADQQAKGKSTMKVIKKVAAKRRLSTDSIKRGKKKIRRKSADTPRKGKSMKGSSSHSSDVPSLEEVGESKIEAPEPKLRIESMDVQQQPNVESKTSKQDTNSVKVEASSPRKKGAVVKAESQNPEMEVNQKSKSDSSSSKPEITVVEVASASHKSELQVKKCENLSPKTISSRKSETSSQKSESSPRKSEVSSRKPETMPHKSQILSRRSEVLLHKLETPVPLKSEIPTPKTEIFTNSETTPKKLETPSQKSENPRISEPPQLKSESKKTEVLSCKSEPLKSEVTSNKPDTTTQKAEPKSATLPYKLEAPPHKSESLPSKSGEVLYKSEVQSHKSEEQLHKSEKLLHNLETLSNKLDLQYNNLKTGSHKSETSFHQPELQTRKFEIPLPKAEHLTPKVELEIVSDLLKVETKDEKTNVAQTTSPRTPTRTSSRTRRVGTDSPSIPEIPSDKKTNITEIASEMSNIIHDIEAKDKGNVASKEEQSLEEKKTSLVPSVHPTPGHSVASSGLSLPPPTSSTSAATLTAAVPKSTTASSAPPSLSSLSSSSSSVTTASIASNNNNGNSGNNTSLDMSADSLPSPYSESFPSEEDPMGGSSRRERRHREGGKKKKRDRDKDKDEGGRKRKKHHRERHSLGEMASEMVSPFRIKIKPLPPRPNGSEGQCGSGTPTDSHAESTLASHTTSTTTTAPPGYPPLPPGYKLTQPMIVGSGIATTSQDRINGSNNRTSTPPITNAATVGTTASIPTFTTAAASTSSTTSTAPAVTPSVGRPPGAGRRKSDPVAEQFSKCDVCGETGGVTNTVMCDECLKAYHFNCLEPPLKKSPKRRGYSWFCEDCDNATSSQV